MATMTVLDSVGGTQTVEKPLTPGQTTRANSRPVTIASEDITALTATQTISGTVTVNALPAGTNNIGDVDVLTLPIQMGAGAATGTTTRVTIDTGQAGSLVAGGVPVVSGGYEYETVAISQTDQIMGATGAVGDYLESLLCVVATAATSQVQIKDGNGSAITVLPNNVGAGVGTYPLPIGLTCVNATTPGWKITTAAGVSVIATGNFT